MNDKEFFETNPILKQINKNSNDELRKKLLEKPILTFNELMILPSEENNFMIDNLLWEHQVVILLAREKVGKSVLSKHMACCLSSGETFLETFDVKRPFKVLYIQLEGDRDESRSRLNRMSKGVKVNPENFFFMFKARIFLDIQSEMEKLCKEIDDMNIRPDVIFIDPLYTALKGSVSKDDVASAFIGNIRTMQEKYECSIIIVHHNHKPIRHKEGFFIDEGDDAIMGSSYLKNFANHVILLTKDKNDIRTLGCTTQRNGKVFRAIKLEMVEPEPLMFKIHHKEKQVDNDTFMLKLKVYNKEFSAADIVGLTALEEGTVRNKLSMLKKKGQIKSVSHGKYVVVK